MFFTQEDYKKIQQWLIKNSVKDTEFNEANIPFNGNEIVSIVQGNQNKKVFLKDLVSQIFNLGVSDFVNITDKYDAPNISLEEAIRLIPSRARKEGQVITFLDMEDHWHIYQFKGVLNQWNVLDQWEDLFDWENLIIDSILPDEEDLTKSLPDVNGNSYLSLKDREYNPNEFSGLGRVILRKNILEIEDPIYGKDKKNILNQDMINKENTIYEIRYDFDLNGEEITIPESCVLDFQGGSFSNGIINGVNTNIKYSDKSIFENINITGVWAVPIIKSSMFADIEDNNVVKQLFNLANDNIYNEVYLDNKIFNVSVDSDNATVLSINKNTKVYNLGVFRLKGNALDNYSIIEIAKDNIIFCGGVIEGDSDTHIGTTGEWGHGIVISNSAKNIVVKDIEILKCWGDGINITGKSQKILIEHCDIHDCGRLGLSVTHASNVIVNNCEIKNIIRTEPKACIDIEPNSNNEVRKVTISNCDFSNTDENRCVVVTSLSEVKLISDIVIENCTFNGSRRCLQIHNRTNHNTMHNFIVRNNKFINVNGLGIYFNHVENVTFENNEAVSVNREINEGDDYLLYFNICPNVYCYNNNLFSYINGIRAVYEADIVNKELFINNNVIECFGYTIETNYANLENNTITLHKPITTYGCLKNNTIKTSEDFTGRLVYLEGKGSLVNNTIEINSSNEVIPVYCGGFNVIKDNRFKSTINNTNIPEIIGGRASAERIICINNDFGNIVTINGYINDSIYSHGKYYIESYNKKWDTDTPNDANYGEAFYQYALKSPLWYYRSEKTWLNAQGVDMTGVTAVIGNSSKREEMTLTESNRGFQYYDLDYRSPTWWDGERWVDNNKFTLALHAGLKSHRPTNLSSKDVGFQYYDKTLEKPIWLADVSVDGTMKWVDATGANV